MMERCGCCSGGASPPAHSRHHEKRGAGKERRARWPRTTLATHEKCVSSFQLPFPEEGDRNEGAPTAREGPERSPAQVRRPRDVPKPHATGTAAKRFLLNSGAD